MSKEVVQDQQPFDVAWRTIDGLKIRHATNGRGGVKVVLFSPWPESIFAFAPVWGGLTKQFIEAPALPPLNAVEVIGGFLGSIRGYGVPRFVRDNYLASYEGDRLTRSAALVRAYPKDLAALAPRLASVKAPVAIVVGRNDPYGLAGTRRFCANDCRTRAWTFSRPVIASGRSERPSSSRSSRNG